MGSGRSRTVDIRSSDPRQARPTYRVAEGWNSQDLRGSMTDVEPAMWLVPEEGHLSVERMARLDTKCAPRSALASHSRRGTGGGERHSVRTPGHSDRGPEWI